jgi:hypothetical protein
MSFKLTPQVTVFEREDWGYRTACGLATQGWDAREVFIHHTDDTAAGIGSLQDQIARMRDYQNFHINTRGWCAIGYHYVAFPEFVSDAGNHIYARIFEGRPRNAVPAAQEGHNAGTLAVCVVGAGDARMDDSQRYAVEVLLNWLKDQGAPLRTLGGHRDVTATSCPGNGIYGRDLPILRSATGLRAYS